MKISKYVLAMFVLAFGFVSFAGVAGLANFYNSSTVYAETETSPTEENVDLPELPLENSVEVTEEASLAIPATASPSLEISMSVLNTGTILTGEQIIWEIKWRCASVDTSCLDAVINVPKPANMSIDQAGVSYPGGESASSDSAYITSATADGVGAQFTFVSDLPAGTSGTALVTFTSDANLLGTIADGTVFTADATMTSSNAPSVTVSASATVTSTLALDMYQVRLPASSPSNPSLDRDVTYELHFGDPRSGCGVTRGYVPGSAASRNLTIQDTFQMGVVFVSASNGGTFDPTTSTVTWPTVDYLGNSSYCDNFINRPYLVKVRYPSATFALTDVVTSDAFIYGEMTNQPSTNTSDNDPISHGFSAIVNAGSFYKAACGGIDPCAVIPGRATDYDFFVSNVGTTSTDFTLKDSLPCPDVSPAFGSPCANPGFEVSAFGVWNPNLSMPVTVNYTTNLGNTGSIVMTNYYTVYPVSYTVPTEFIKDFTITGTISGDRSIQIRAMGKVPTTYSYPDQVNTAEVLFDFGGGITQNITDTATLNIILPQPYILNFKGLVSGGVVAPGQTTVFNYTFLNQGEVEVNPVLIDLLPLGYEYVPGSVTTNPIYGLGDLGGLLPTETVTVNFNGTGRDLVRFNWPTTEKIGTGGTTAGYQNITFSARVKANALPASGVNKMYLGSSDNDLKFGCVYGKIQDSDDMDADGSTTDYLCQAGSDASYTITKVSGVVIEKSVKGSLDSSYLMPPSMGHTPAGGTGEYKITIKNRGSATLSNTIIYDILPYVGDMGISHSQLSNPRNSQFQVDLNSALTGGDLSGATVEYSMSNNPCRNEVASPATCDNDWTTTFSSGARAYKVSFGSTVLPVGGEKTFIVPIKVSGSATISDIAWNSIALSTKNDVSGLLSTEGQVVGLTIEPTRVDLPECSDGVDNDRDGKVDYPDDKGCSGPNDNNERNSGGTSGGGRVGGGLVLGAQTCSLDINTYMRKGYKNDVEQVKIAQNLLNQFVNVNLVVDGEFGLKTEAAVKAFQLKYRSEVIDPWAGLNGQPTGIIYKTTLVKMKNLLCGEPELPIPTDLIDWSKNKKETPPPLSIPIPLSYNYYFGL